MTALKPLVWGKFSNIMLSPTRDKPPKSSLSYLYKYRPTKKLKKVITKRQCLTMWKTNKKNISQTAKFRISKKDLKNFASWNPKPKLYKWSWIYQKATTPPKKMKISLYWKGTRKLWYLYRVIRRLTTIMTVFSMLTRHNIAILGGWRHPW